MLSPRPRLFILFIFRDTIEIICRTRMEVKCILENSKTHNIFDFFKHELFLCFYNYLHN